MTKPWFPGRDRAFLAPEVVQTSSMDCGPAALKCLLDGHGVPVSYGRLREACQTSVDGTSIDTIEAVAIQLGLNAEQTLVPRDFVCLDGVHGFPAMVVVRHSDTATHFVVVWARHGRWLQIMDPAVGRVWISQRRFEAEIFRHEQGVDAIDWRAWCDTDDFRRPMQQRLVALGFEPAASSALIAEAAQDAGWFGFGALDAGVRLCTALVDAGGLARGREAVAVATALYRDTFASGNDIHAIIPIGYWSARPDRSNTDPRVEMLRISGAVVLKAANLAPAAIRPPIADLPVELAAALVETAPAPWTQFWQLLRTDAGLHPGLMGGAIVIQALALIGEALLFRGLLEVSRQLALPHQRVAALAALTVLALVLGLLGLGFSAYCVRHGRRLELQMRRAILAKLPLLKDRYFQSRPITDMADRNHNIHLIRALPGLAFQSVQTVSELGFTFAAIVVIAPGSLGWALATVAVALLLPTLVQPLLNERDLRLRNHGGALHGFFLDALLGLAPIRAHRAQQAVARQHESLLVEWARSATGLARLSLATEAVQMSLCMGLVGALLLGHFAAEGAMRGSDLLLVFWALRLPGSADRLAGLARQYPAARNTLLRQMEPLNAPEEARASLAAMVPKGAATVSITKGSVVAGGHAILRDIELMIAPGEHVAIVGRSGAGKSSLLGLLLGWHQLAAGELRVDGTELAGDTLVALRQRTAWVDPQVQIWNRSLLDNLIYATDDESLVKARLLVEASGLLDITSRLPQGLQTPLGEGGGLLSGGEAQRVRLGRAMMTAAPRLVLLDEPFRGLDRGQRHAMLASARAWWSKTTLLCVTHDIEETLNFDRVLVIEDGLIVEDGNPAQLITGATRYRALREAEAAVHRDMWQATPWRRINIAAGSVTELTVA